MLLEHLGCEVKGFQHRSAGSEREIIQLIAKIIQDKIVDQVKSCPTYGILMDDMTDVTSKEQMILFIQYYCRKEEKVKTKFLSVESVLDQSDSCSANAETLFQVFSKKLNELGLDVTKVGGMAPDDALVMLGRNNGVAAKLKAIAPSVIAVHCVCHRLALACADSNQELSYIEKITTYLTELWKLFEYSNQKMAVFMKTQLNLINLQLLPSVKKKTAKKIKKACKNTLAFHRQCRQISCGKLSRYHTNPSQTGGKMRYISRSTTTHEHRQVSQYNVHSTFCSAHTF